MKKSIIAILMCLAFVFSLAACSSDNNSETAVDTDTTETEETSAGGFTSADGMFELNDENFVRDEEESSYCDNEITYILATYEVLSLPEQGAELYPELATALENINTEVREYATDIVRDNMEFADETYENDPDRFANGQYFTYEYKYNPIYVSDKYVSLTVEDYYDMGGVHPSSNYHAYTVDIATGEDVKIGDIVNDTNALVDAVAEKLEEYYGEGINYTGDELKAYIMCTFTGELYNDNVVDIPWTVTENGLALYFGDYAVASYAAGHYVCEINSADYPDLFK